MKKILAFLMAVTTCFCAFTACGDTDESEGKKSDKSSSSEKDSDEKDSNDKNFDNENSDDKDEDDDKDSDKKNKGSEDKKSSKTDKDDSGKDIDKFEIGGEDVDDDNDIDEDDNEKKPVNNKENTSSNVSDDVFLDIFNDFCENAMVKNTDGLMNQTFPDKLIDAMKKTNSYDFMAEELNDSYDAMEEIDLSSIVISNVADCDAETKQNLEKLYSVYSNLFICMAENDIMYDALESGEIDEAKAMLILEPAMQLSQLDDIDNLDVNISIPFEEAKFVTFTADGEDQKFVMYKADGEDWKIDTIGFAFFDF